MVISAGLMACEAALGRLLEGSPTVPEFVGASSEMITPAMVSVEAGFDKGYLKRSRRNHMPLIAKIAALRISNVDPAKQKLVKAKKTADQATMEVGRMQVIIDSVLTQNLMLVERVRELERELKVSKGAL